MAKRFVVVVVGAFGLAGCLSDRAGEPLSPTCSNGVLDPGESGVDCGGECQACPDVGCGDCLSDERCDDGECVASRCDDGVQAGGETGVDCGGPCAPCAPLGECDNDMDCGAGEVCREQSCVPQASRCDDGMIGGDETDVDCGGAECGPCREGARCNEAGDCATDLCVDGRCVASEASCQDGVKNGGESDVDCGGDCPPCRTGLFCADESDCESRRCVAGLCTESCFDGEVSGDETDIDCGGQRCEPCFLGAFCGNDGDCETQACDDGVCVPNDGISCSQGIQCYNACAENAVDPDGCIQDCIDSMSPAAQGLFIAIFDCLFNTCPDGDQECIDTAAQEACGPTVAACFSDQ